MSGKEGKGSRARPFAVENDCVGNSNKCSPSEENMNHKMQKKTSTMDIALQHRFWKLPMALRVDTLHVQCVRMHYIFYVVQKCFTQYSLKMFSNTLHMALALVVWHIITNSH